MKRFAAVFLVLILIAVGLCACGQPAPQSVSQSAPESESAAPAAHLSIKEDVALALRLADATAWCDVAVPFTDGLTTYAKAWIQESTDGGMHYEGFGRIWEGELTEALDVTTSFSPLEDGNYYRILLNVVQKNPDGSVAEMFTLYTGDHYYGLTYNERAAMVAAALPDKTIFSCESTDKLEIGRAAMEYSLGLYDERVPEYGRISSYKVTDVKLAAVGADSFCVYVTYDLSTLGGLFRPVNGDATKHDPTDDVRLLHGLDITGESRFACIRELGGGSYELYEVNTGGLMDGMVPVNADGSVDTTLTLKLVRGGSEKTLLLDTAGADYIRLYNYTLASDAAALSLPEAEIEALPEYLYLEKNYPNGENPNDNYFYIYKNADGVCCFQRYNRLVTATLSQAEYDALVELAERAGM